MDSYHYEWVINAGDRAQVHPTTGNKPIPHVWLDRKYGTSILEILLDTEGAKAAYGEWGGMMADPAVKTGKHLAITIAILRAWHSGPGNNVRAALEAAVSFLPQP